jgi:hypothetical protein
MCEVFHNTSIAPLYHFNPLYAKHALLWFMDFIRSRGKNTAGVLNCRFIKKFMEVGKSFGLPKSLMKRDTLNVGLIGHRFFQRYQMSICNQFLITFILYIRRNTKVSQFLELLFHWLLFFLLSQLYKLCLHSVKWPSAFFHALLWFRLDNPCTVSLLVAHTSSATASITYRGTHHIAGPLVFSWIFISDHAIDCEDRINSTVFRGSKHRKDWNFLNL